MAFTVSVCLRVLRLLGQFSPSPTDMSVFHLFRASASVKIPRFCLKKELCKYCSYHVTLNLLRFSHTGYTFHILFIIFPDPFLLDVSDVWDILQSFVKVGRRTNNDSYGDVNDVSWKWPRKSHASRWNHVENMTVTSVLAQKERQFTARSRFKSYALHANHRSCNYQNQKRAK